MNARAIQALVGCGADAYLNMFDVFIKFPWADAEEVMVRAQGFEPPEAEIEKGDRHYHGVGMSTPKPNQTYTRDCSITFRSDAAYGLYASFIQWNQAVIDPVNGGVSNWQSALGTIKVRALTGNYTAAEEAKTLVGTGGEILASTTNAVWTFAQCWVRKVGQPKYSQDSANEFTFTVDFSFADTDYPFFNGAGSVGTDTTNI